MTWSDLDFYTWIINCCKGTVLWDNNCKETLLCHVGGNMKKQELRKTQIVIFLKGSYCQWKLGQKTVYDKLIRLETFVCNSERPKYHFHFRSIDVIITSFNIYETNIHEIFTIEYGMICELLFPAWLVLVSLVSAIITLRIQISR